MSIDRKTIWVAVFTHLRTKLADKFEVIGRRHIMPNKLGLEQQPALFIIQGKETRSQLAEREGGTLALHGWLVIYVREKNSTVPPGQEKRVAADDINELLAAVDDALAPDDGNEDGYCTLGGLVQHCWISGDTEIDPAIQDGQAAASVPIHILVP